MKLVLQFASTSWKEVMKMELLVDHILGLFKQSSNFAEGCRLKLMPNGVSFFIFF